MDFFSPLSKESCKYFYLFSIIAGVILAITFVGAVFVIITNFKKLNLVTYYSIGYILLNTFLIYFLNRLLYSMCINSLN